MSSTCVLFILNYDIIFAQSRAQPSVINHTPEGHRIPCMPACGKPSTRTAFNTIIIQNRTLCRTKRYDGLGVFLHNNNNNCRNQRQKTSNRLHCRTLPRKAVSVATGNATKPLGLGWVAGVCYIRCT